MNWALNPKSTWTVVSVIAMAPNVLQKTMKFIQFIKNSDVHDTL
jgi:hypothetical protein